MTFREKMQKGHPNYIHKGYCGGVSGCPSDYFKEKEGLCVGRLDPSREKCTKCWDREIPTEDNAEEKENTTKNLSDDHGDFICEKCGFAIGPMIKIVIDEGERILQLFEYKFCPECGRKVVE